MRFKFVWNRERGRRKKRALVLSPRGASFTPLVPRPGLALELGGPHPTLASAWRDSNLRLPAIGTHFAYAMAGTSVLRTAGGSYTLQPGMYAGFVEGEVHGEGSGLVATRLGVFGMFQLGGPIEARGRLSYIDGCSDSLLLAPARLGDPCLNHLHIPRNTRQTQHSHPSLRVGVIARGKGRCVTPQGEHPLEPGLGFVIATDALHSFFTDDEPLDVVVYHPDSDTGPTDEDHPMINRTIIAGG